MVNRLSASDAAFFHLENTATPMYVGSLSILRKPRAGLSYETLLETVEHRLPQIPRYRQKVREVTLGLARPVWVDDRDFDITYHIRRSALPKPGSDEQLHELVARLSSRPLDKTLPLWEMYFVEGLANGRIAVVGKIHHALADGVASANLLARGMDLSDGPQRDDDSYATDPAPSSGELVRSAFADHMRQLGRLPATVRYTAQGFGRVRRSHRKLSPELTRPFTPPPSFMNHILDEKRLFATATLALADVKETSKKLGVTINDLVLAMSSGALRKLSLKYDGKADHPLLASVPMSFDFSPDRISGNRFSGVLVALPVDIADTAERVQRAHEAAALAKESHQLIGPELIARWAAYMPPAPVEAAFKWLSNKDGQNKVLNLNISNVPGPRERGKVGGATVTEIYSVGPITTGSGLNITVWSYVDQLNISVLSDDATVEDPHEVTDGMVEEFREIRRVAGLSDKLTVVESAMPQ